MSGPETIPLSDYCPLRMSELDDSTKIGLRNRAAELFYGSLLETDELSGALVDELEVDHLSADYAVECLGKIYRNNCPNCVIGETEAGRGIVPREPIE